MSVDASEVTGALQGLREYLRESRVLGARMALEAMQGAFDAATDPSTGHPWPPLAESTKEAGRTVPLVDTGQLRESLEEGARGNIFRIGRTAIAIGTSDRTAPFHQHSTKPHEISAKPGGVLHWPPNHFAKRVRHPGNPRRPVVGVSKATARLIERAMMVDSQAAMEKGKRR